MVGLGKECDVRAMVYGVNVGHISLFLQEVDVFAGLSERNLDRIASLCEELSFAQGELLGVEHELGSRLYVVRSGAVGVSVGGDGGVVVRTVREREAFPIAALMEPPLLVTTTRALTEVRALVIPRVRLMELCELVPEIGRHIYRASCGVVMNRYRFTLGMLSDSVDRGVGGGVVWRGAEV